MNHVSVVFEAMNRYCKICIDGEPISQYSDLANCESKDLHVCAPKLIELLDQEICDSYAVEIKGDPFQIELLKAVAKSSAYCEEVVGTVVQPPFPVDEELSFLQTLITRYSLDIRRNLQIAVRGGSLFPNMPAYMKETSGDCDLLFTAEAPAGNADAATVVVLSDTLGIKNGRGMNIVMLPLRSLQAFSDYYYMYCKLIPFVDKVISLCRYVNMSGSDKMRLSAYIESKPKYIFKMDSEACDAGDSVAFSFEVFPGSAVNAYRMVNDTPEVLKLNDGSLTAVGAGTGKIRILDRQGNVCETRAIQVQAHSYVKSIRLIAAFPYLREGQKGKIEAFVVPDSAEDAKSISWESSNNDIVHVSSTGEVVAFKPGRATITASCRRCSENILVEVRPPLEQITLSESYMKLELGKSRTVSCRLVPENAAHDKIIWELDNDGLGTLKVSDDGRTCEFTATTSALPKGALKCYEKNGTKSASCGIEIIPENTPVGLMTCALIFTILGMVFSFLIPTIWAVGGGILGYFLDFMLPVSLVLSLIGKAKSNVRTFSTCLTLNLICTCVMFFFAITCCS